MCEPLLRPGDRQLAEPGPGKGRAELVPELRQQSGEQGGPVRADTLRGSAAEQAGADAEPIFSAMQSRERSYYPKYACADTNYTLSDFEHDLDSFCAGLGSELVKLLYGYAGEVYIFSSEATNLIWKGKPIDIAELNRIHQEKAEWIAKRIIEMDMKGEMPSEGALLGGKLTADLIGMGAGLGAAGYGGGQMIGGATMAIVAPGVGTVAVVSAIPTGALIYVAGSGGFLYAGNAFKENIDKAEEKKGESNTQGNGVPVKEKTKASNGLDYQSNPKHTPGQPGNRPNAGVEPKNSLDLFGESVPSTSKPSQRFTYDTETNTLHRFYNDGNGTWHWSGSTNQGANSITGSQVPNDIKNTFDLPKKGW